VKIRTLFGGVLAVGLMAGLAACNTNSTSYVGASKSEAFTMCQQFLTPRLVSPTSVHYRDFYGSQAPTVTDEGNSEYDVQSTVDSQNGFGAEVRSSFDCDITLSTSDHMWNLNKLTLTGPDGTTQDLTT
jgi:hypothetical protein